MTTGSPENLKVSELVDTVGERQAPTVSSQASLREAVETFERQRHTRVLYVVDETERIVGILTAGSLLRHAETYGLTPQIHARRIPALLSGDTVEQIMIHHPITIKRSDTVGVAVRRMSETGAKELPVVDKNGRVTADLTIIDILYYCLVPAPDGPASGPTANTWPRHA